MIWGAPMTKRNPPLSHGCSILIPVSSALNHHTSFQVPAAAPVVALSYLGSRLFGPAMAEVFFWPQGIQTVWICLDHVVLNFEIQQDQNSIPMSMFFCVFLVGVFLENPVWHIQLNTSSISEFWGFGVWNMVEHLCPERAMIPLECWTRWVVVGATGCQWLGTALKLVADPPKACLDRFNNYQFSTWIWIILQPYPNWSKQFVSGSPRSFDDLLILDHTMTIH